MPPPETLQAAAPASTYELALVLSGGGARGYAHVGVLRVIEQLALPIDLVVGVSMGGIVGAGYAAGFSSARMSELAASVQVQHVFRPRLGRLGLVDPDGMRAALERVFGNRRFKDLDRELIVVSSSVTSGLPVAISDGSVVEALVASSAIPLVFPPVMRGGDQLLDGGLIEVLPIQLARELGASRIVAVDVSSHTKHLFRLPGVRHATRRVVRILRRRQAELDALHIAERMLHYAAERPAPPPVEALIRPSFGLHTSLHYHRSAELVARGAAAAEAVRPRLVALGAEARRARSHPVAPALD
jgi:NTE family protein